MNHTNINKEGVVQHTVTINDGNYAPQCTQKALEDHLGEFASAKDGQFVFKVEFDKPYTQDTIDSYENFRDSIHKKDEQGNIPYPNVEVVFPWDER